MRHLMIDVETMGGAPDGAVIAIGARLFTETEILQGFEVFIDTEAAKRFGRVDQRTMNWWSKQDPDVYKQVFSGRVQPPDAALRLRQFIEEHQPKEVWAYPPHFDLLILQNLFRRVNLEWPFHYRDERCARTIKAWGASHGLNFDDCYDGITKHLPLDDATAQAKVIQRVMSLRTQRAPKQRAPKQRAA